MKQKEQEKEKQGEDSTDPQSATTTRDRTAEEPRQAEEALSGASCSGEETLPEHSIPQQLTLPEQVARLNETIKALQYRIDSPKDRSEREGLQEPLTRTQHGLKNPEISPLQQELLPGNQLPFPHSPSFQHEPTTRWGETHITTTSDVPRRTSRWTCEFHQVSRMKRRVQNRKKLLMRYRFVEIQ
jgi:hypothetical protein